MLPWIIVVQWNNLDPTEGGLCHSTFFKMTTAEELLRESKRLVQLAALDIYDGSDGLEESGLIPPDAREDVARIARQIHPDTVKMYKSSSNDRNPLYTTKIDE